MLRPLMRNRMDNAKEWEDYMYIMRNLRWYRQEGLIRERDK